MTEMESVLNIQVKESKDVISILLTYKEEEVMKEKEYIFFKDMGVFLSQALEHAMRKGFTKNDATKNTKS
jgi:hypothetical protein